MSGYVFDGNVCYIVDVGWFERVDGVFVEYLVELGYLIVYV